RSMTTTTPPASLCCPTTSLRSSCVPGSTLGVARPSLQLSSMPASTRGSTHACASERCVQQPGMGSVRPVRGYGRAHVFSLKPLPHLAIYEDTPDGILVLRLYHGKRAPIAR